MPLPAGAATCPECGAPVGNATTADTEAAVYPELAKANLARMRGDYKQAEVQLLSVLKRFPNNPSANEMLGDLAAEREDYPQAVQWFEMAMEIVPNSASIARKLREARSKIDQKDAKDTTAQLGLPDPSSRMPILIGVLVIVILAVAAGAYVLGAKGGGSERKLPVPTNVVSATPDQTSNPSPSGNVPSPAKQTAAGVAEEENLMATLTGKSADAASVLAVTHDPRTGNLIITFNLTGKDDRALAARLARDAFASLPGYSAATMRGVSEGKVTYMADVTKSKVTETDSPDWKQQHQNEPEAWIAYVIQNEWPVATPSTSTAPPPGDTTTASTSGTTPPIQGGATATGGGQ